MVLERKNCRQCGAGFQPKRDNADFCGDKCRGKWHREHDPAGDVRSVKRLMRGKVSVTVHLTDQEAERALHLRVGQRVVLGALDALLPSERLPEGEAT